MFGQRHPVLNLDEYAVDQSLEIPETFESIQQAKSYLELLASGVFRLRGDLMQKAQDAALTASETPTDLDHLECYIKALSRSVDLGADGPTISSRRAALESDLLNFGSAFRTCSQRAEIPSDRSAMAIQIEYIQILFLIVTCRDTRECSSDAFHDLFASAVELAAKYMDLAPRVADSKPKRAFALEPGILPTVFLVAEKCRDYGIRQKAIKLMQEGCTQEAMWDGKPYSTFMQVLADIEAQEPHVVHGVCNPKASTDTRMCNLESARMSEVVLVGEGQNAKLVCARYRHDGTIEIKEYPVDPTGDAQYLHNLSYGWT